MQLLQILIEARTFPVKTQKSLKVLHFRYGFKKSLDLAVFDRKFVKVFYL